MRRLFSSGSLCLAATSVRCCNDDFRIAPKRKRAGVTVGDMPASPTGGEATASSAAHRPSKLSLDVDKLLKSMPKDPMAHAQLSTSELEKKVEEWSKMTPAELDELYKKYEELEQQETRVLQEDSLMQMDVSLKSRSTSAVRVFWKDVDIAEIAGHPGFYHVLVQGRPIKAFENTQPLVLPSQDFALACAKEWSEQVGYINKLIMPLTDMASGSMQVAPQAVAPRIDYLMSFYQNDNCYFRADKIQAEQDAMIEPIRVWFEDRFSVSVPRIVGIGHPNISPLSVAKVRDTIVAMNLNQYQVVALCVVAQFTSSLLLPLALFHDVIDLETALKINKAEEGHNISTHGEIKGYHDIRETDVVSKICAATVAYRMAASKSSAECAMVITG